MSVVELLSELVSLPSLNPGATNRQEWIGEGRVADALQRMLEERDFTCERMAFTSAAPGAHHEITREQVLGRAGNPSPARTLMIEGHMDTVGVENMTIPAFTPTVADGRLQGRGSTDTKGPIAAALAGLTPRVRDLFATTPNQILFIGACAEEVGCHGAIALAKAGIGADWAIVLEPTGLAPVIAHKGTVWAYIDLIGRSCHGSQPEKGINAIDAAVDLVRACRDMPFRVTEDNLLGHPTRNVGVLQGGVSANIVPNRCRLELDMRTLPGEDAEALLDFIRTQLEAMIADGRLLAYELQPDICPAFSTDPQSELVQALMGFTGQPATGSTWYSDAGPLSATCGEIAVFGPGSIAQAHTKDEFILLEDLHAGAEAFEQLYLSFLAS